MEQIRLTETFCGVDIFTWGSWDLIGTDMLYFYDVEFCIESMKKYNGCDVMKKLDGTMEVYVKNGQDVPLQVIWSGMITDIPEVLESLVRSKVNTNTADKLFVEYLKKIFMRKMDVCE